MKIALITPAPVGSRHGNRNTALRWARLLRELGHRTRVQVAWDGSSADAMLALHARRSYESIQKFSAQCPGRPLIVVLTGTDLYRDIVADVSAQRSLHLATRLVVLQDAGLEELAPPLRAKTRVIYQSTNRIDAQRPLRSLFEVCVIGHLRDEKDPFRTALALSYLPHTSRLIVTHVGMAMSEATTQQARQMMQLQARYRWLGEVTLGKAQRLVARSRLMVISSRIEGGANVVSEALMAGTPILASRIPGNIGMLGDDYAGYFPVADERALAALLIKAETDADFLAHLQGQCRVRRELILPESEKRALADLLQDDARTLRP
jgi:putative glycosyltransferase (TIGR04348 family)